MGRRHVPGELEDHAGWVDEPQGVIARVAVEIELLGVSEAIRRDD